MPVDRLSSHRCHFIQSVLLLLTMSCCIVAGCRSNDNPWSREAFDLEVARAAQLSDYATNAIEQRRRLTGGTAIHIPPTTISMPRYDDFESQQETVFQIDVYVEIPPEYRDIPLENLLEDELRVDVLGAKKSKIKVATYDSSKGVEVIERDSGNLVQVHVKPDDIEHSLTVVAQFPELAGNWERSERISTLNKSRINVVNAYDDLVAIIRDDIGDRDKAEKTLRQALKDYTNLAGAKNPFREVREVPVYNGDLITQVYMLSNDEISDAFGKNFANHFHVGKAYFKNRHPNKKLIVNTTSLRAKCIFFRPPNPALDGVRDDEHGGGIFSLLYEGAFGSETPDDFHSLDLMLAQQIKYEGGNAPGSIAPSSREESQTDFDSEELDNIVESDLFKALSDVYAMVKKDKPPENSIFYNTFAEEYFYKVLAFDLSAAGDAEKTINGLIDAVDNTARRLMLRDYVRIRSELYLRNPYDLENDPMAADQIEEAQNSAINGNGRTAFKDGALESVGPSGKKLATSHDMVFQRALARTGYVFEDYYRPMTFEAVLISLIKKTEESDINRVLDTLESVGVVAGALVGLDALTGEFGTKSFAQGVALATGVFLPELRKLLMEDIEEYLPNLASMGLGTQFTIGPNESRDGYIFFPKGAIMGYGVDEFSVNTPSWLVNIDNANVSVDATLVDRGFEFSSGVQDPDDQISGALNSVKTRRARRQAELGEVQSRLKTLMSQEVNENVKVLIDEGKVDEAARVVAEFASTETGKSAEALVSNLKAQINQKQSSEGIVLWKSDQGGGNLATALVFGKAPDVTVQVDGKDVVKNQWTASYRVLLSREMRDGAQALLSVQPIITQDLLDMKVGFVATVEDKNTGPQKPAVGIEFKDDVDDQDWHDPRNITVTLTAPQTVKLEHLLLEELRIRHRLISGDATFDSERILWFELPNK